MLKKHIECEKSGETKINQRFSKTLALILESLQNLKMEELEASILNWFQFQSSQETVMDMNTNLIVLMFTELAHGILLRFQYGIIFVTHANKHLL